MVKKLLAAIGVIIAIIVLVVIVVGIIIYIKVDKTFIENQLSKALNRQVSIEAVDVGIFSVISGFEVKNLAISNFKTPGELKALQGKPVEKTDLFSGMETLRFKLKFLPLLCGKIDLRELVLYKPVVNLSKNRQGVLNIDDLIKSKKTPADETPKEPPAGGPAKPLTADDIPLSVVAGEIGMKNGTINYRDDQYDQTFQIYNLTALLHDIQIDPESLDQKNEIKTKLDMGIKTVGAMKTGSVQNFNVTIDAAGKVIPFDKKTRQLNPEVILHVGMPAGEVTGLQIFNAVAAVPILGDYLGQHLSFLQGKQQWKGSDKNGWDLRYKAGQAEITNGNLDLEQTKLHFNGGMNLDSRALAMNLNMLMKKEINDAVRTSLAQKIDAAIKSPDVKKYVNSLSVAQEAMKPLLNDEGFIDLSAAIGGTIQKPAITLTKPALTSLGGLVKDTIEDAAVEAGKEAVKGAARKYLKEDQQKMLEDVGGLLKKK